MALLEDYKWVADSVCKCASYLNDQLVSFGISHLSAILIGTLAGYTFCSILWHATDSSDSISGRILSSFFGIVRKMPFVRSYIAGEKQKMISSIREKRVAKQNSDSVVRKLPGKGLSSKEVLDRLSEYSGTLADNGSIWKKGRLSGGVYHNRHELDKLAVSVYEAQLHSNPLHFDVFPDTTRCEAELISMVWNMYNGPSSGEANACGVVTSGGTESIILAVLSARNLALQRGVRWPEIIMCTTAHAAFVKAAEMFRMRIRTISPIMPSGKVNVSAMRRAINSSTCLLVGSCPCFPWGVVDPIDEIAGLGAKYGIPVHVDCCLGGFLVPFAEAAGYPLDCVFDFRLKGVTSISCDTHKYGLAPKGSSILLYRNANLRAAQVFVTPDWPGGVYATPSLAGSRCGALGAAAWATCLQVGHDGYVDLTRKILGAAKNLRSQISKIPGLRTVGSSANVSGVAFGMTEQYDAKIIFSVYDKMLVHGWHINALQFPSAISIVLTDMHAEPGVLDDFVAKLTLATATTLDELQKGTLDKKGAVAVYGSTQSVPDRGLVGDFIKAVIEDILTL